MARKRWIATVGKKGNTDLKAQALVWATAELSRCRARNWNPGEAENHVIAEVGRRWNIGCEAYVREMLKITWTDTDGPEPEDENEDE